GADRRMDDDGLASVQPPDLVGRVPAVGDEGGDAVVATVKSAQARPRRGQGGASDEASESAAVVGPARPEVPGRAVAIAQVGDRPAGDRLDRRSNALDERRTGRDEQV